MLQVQRHCRDVHDCRTLPSLLQAGLPFRHLLAIHHKNIFEEIFPYNDIYGLPGLLCWAPVLGSNFFRVAVIGGKIGPRFFPDGRPFCMQRDNLFYTAMSYCSPATLLRVPYSLTEAVTWTVLTYFEVGLAANPGRCLPDICPLRSRLCMI